jgi:hypothetical protein
MSIFSSKTRDEAKKTLKKGAKTLRNAQKQFKKAQKHLKNASKKWQKSAVSRSETRQGRVFNFGNLIPRCFENNGGKVRE